MAKSGTQPLLSKSWISRSRIARSALSGTMSRSPARAPRPTALRSIEDIPVSLSRGFGRGGRVVTARELGHRRPEAVPQERPERPPLLGDDHRRKDQVDDPDGDALELADALGQHRAEHELREEEAEERVGLLDAD